MSTPASISADAQRAEFIRHHMPSAGLFAGHTWRISPAPLRLDPATIKEFEILGRVLLKFYQALDLLYRSSVAGKHPEWISRLLDQGKPRSIIDWQRSAAFRNQAPRVIRPDLLLTETGFSITELDSVPGGIGLTAWLNRIYSEADHAFPPAHSIVGGPDSMLQGFAGIFGEAPRVHVIVSDESATYRPEMEWLCRQLGDRFAVRDAGFRDFQPGDAVYRFFELFDLPQVPNAAAIFSAVEEGRISVTPPPKPALEEKLMFALLWNRNLRAFWRQNLGEGFFERLLSWTPYSWAVDPAPLPPHAAIPELNIAGWHELKQMSQKQRDLVLKVSGFSEQAWGARGVHVGSDLSQAEWSAAVDQALADFQTRPYLLQRFTHSTKVETRYFNFETGALVSMPARVRLCPYYFVHGAAESARARLGGVLATAVPADKKIVHGMRDAILMPCSIADPAI